MNAKEKLIQEKLVIIARNIPIEPLLRCCEELLKAGLTCLELTFDHLLADPIGDNFNKLTVLQRAFGSALCIGAGTTLSIEEVRAAAQGGAKFVVAPGTKLSVVKESKRLGLVSIPGAMTPTEICEAWDMGADIVKLFPSDDLGLHFIENLKGPLPHIPLMSTGGVNIETIPKLLSAGVCCVGTGVTVFKPSLVKLGDYKTIGLLAQMHAQAIRLWKEENGL